MTSSTEISAAIFEEVKAVVMVTLDIEDQADDLGPDTGLYGNFAELDSLTVVKLIIALRKRFGIDIQFREVVGDVLYTLGGLAAFVESKVNCARGPGRPAPPTGRRSRRPYASRSGSSPSPS